MAAAIARARARPARAPPHRTRTTRNGRLVAAMAIRVRLAASGTESSSMPWTSRSNGSRKYRTPTSMTGVSVRSTSTAATRNGRAVASHARGRPTARSARRSAVGGLSSSGGTGPVSAGSASPAAPRRAPVRSRPPQPPPRPRTGGRPPALPARARPGRRRLGSGRRRLDRALGRRRLGRRRCLGRGRVDRSGPGRGRVLRPARWPAPCPSAWPSLDPCALAPPLRWRSSGVSPSQRRRAAPG